MAFVLSIYPILYHVTFTLNMIEKLDTKISPLNLTLASCPGLWDIFKTPALLYYVVCVPVEVCTHAQLTCAPHVACLKFQFESSIYLGSMCQSICCWQQRHRTVSFPLGVLDIPFGFGMSSFHSPETHSVLKHRDWSVVRTKLEA